MKKLMTVSLFFMLTTLFSSLYAQKGVLEATSPLRAGLDAASHKAYEAFLKELSRKTVRLTWEDFLAKNLYLQQQEQAYLQNLFQEVAAIPHNVKSSKDLPVALLRQSGQFRPDYAQETKEVKYIFLGEQHDTQTITREIPRILAEIRQANPQKRILLATEFAKRTDEKLIPLRFAQQPKKVFEMPPLYHKLLPACTRLNIDVLGLEDDLLLSAPQNKNLGLELQHGSWLKMGDTELIVPYDNPHVLHILKQYDGRVQTQLRKIQQAADVIRQIQLDTNWEQDFTNRVKVFDSQLILNKLTSNLSAYLRNFLAQTNWGLTQRNTQWLRYIQAVSPFYDMVIVYAGSGHFVRRYGDSMSETLPSQINEPYVEFNFHTAEQLPPLLQKAYNKSDKIQKKEKAQIYTQVKALRKILTNEPGLKEMVKDFLKSPLLLPVPPHARQDGTHFIKAPKDLGILFDVYLPDQSTR